MGDADIIPIGTRGKPGRATGTDKPSAAARSLAGERGSRAAAQRRQPEPEAPQ